MQHIGSCAITTPDDVDTLQFDWGIIHMLSEERVTGATSFSFGRVLLQPGQGHIRHNHPLADEIIYVVSGEADQMLDDQPPVRIKSGDCIWIPKGIFHSTINHAEQPIELIVVYAPAGSEQALRQDPAVKITPAKNK